MRYEARVTCFDVLDKVHVAVAVYQTAQTPGEPTLLVGTRVSAAPGTGESDPWLWTRDALVQALENL